uniref:Putative secreted protein n=1 Tax=Anopheles marajoara TaxID=58244 RepID=A0A2M4C8Z5_9DIPT
MVIIMIMFCVYYMRSWTIHFASPRIPVLSVQSERVRACGSEPKCVTFPFWTESYGVSRGRSGLRGAVWYTVAKRFLVINMDKIECTHPHSRARMIAADTG